MEHLATSNDVSLQNRVDAEFSKTLLLSAASYYEHRLTRMIVGFYEANVHGSATLAEFVKNQAIGRRYSQLFDWTSGNANRFFSSFGGEFRSYMRERVRVDLGLAESIRAFLELGNLRNEAVHENYAVFSLNKTVDEVFDLYEKAGHFVEDFPNELSEYIRHNDLHQL